MPRFDRSPRVEEAWLRLDASSSGVRLGAQRLRDGDFVHLLTGNGTSWIGVVFRDDDEGPCFELELADDPTPARLPVRHEAVCRLSAFQRRSSNLPPRIGGRG